MDYIKSNKVNTQLSLHPTSFVITMFHIIFMYPDNITVISKADLDYKHEVQKVTKPVSSMDFARTKRLRGIDFDQS